MPMLKSNRSFIRLGAMFLLLATSACAHTDEYPMHNATTGESVTCHSGVYWLSEDADDRAIGEQCIASCAQHGFQLIPKDQITDNDMLETSTSDVRSTIPPQCLQLIVPKPDNRSQPLL